MQFVAVRGSGKPNYEDGEYKSAFAVLYAISYTIKMSKMGELYLSDLRKTPQEKLKTVIRHPVRKEK